jgi:hypothetical protein
LHDKQSTKWWKRKKTASEAWALEEILRRIHGRDLGEEGNKGDTGCMVRKQEEECLFCGFTLYYHKIKRDGRSLWLVADSKSSTDLTRNRNVFVCVFVCV